MACFCLRRGTKWEVLFKIFTLDGKRLSISVPVLAIMSILYFSRNFFYLSMAIIVLVTVNTIVILPVVLSFFGPCLEVGCSSNELT